MTGMPKIMIFGLDPINWENCPPPKSVEIIAWIKEKKPEVTERMKKGIEPNYGKLNNEYQKYIKQE